MYSMYMLSIVIVCLREIHALMVVTKTQFDLADVLMKIFS